MMFRFCGCSQFPIKKLTKQNESILTLIQYLKMYKMQLFYWINIVFFFLLFYILFHYLSTIRNFLYVRQSGPQRWLITSNRIWTFISTLWMIFKFFHFDWQRKRMLLFGNRFSTKTTRINNKFIEIFMMTLAIWSFWKLC